MSKTQKIKTGKVYLIGAGPGDPELITIKGRKLLSLAQVIIADYLVEESFLNYVGEGVEVYWRYKPGTSNKKKDCISQAQIEQLMVKKARQGHMVCRLKSGDPFVFAKSSEEMYLLSKNNIPYEVIPGVTAANAASCFTGIPLTEKGTSSQFTVVTGQQGNGKMSGLIDWKHMAGQKTIVLYMAMENLDWILKQLKSYGVDKSTPIAIISDISRLTQKTCVGSLLTIKKVAREKKIKSPAIIIIGEVVHKEKMFNWYRKSKKIIYTGLSTEKIKTTGILFHVPMIEIAPLKSYRKLQGYIKGIAKFDWIIFTSRFAVKHFFQQVINLKLDTRIFYAINFAAIGNSTANELLQYGIRADLIPRQSSTEGLLSEFKGYKIVKKYILLPQSNLADGKLAEGLIKKKAQVRICSVYRNKKVSGLPRLDLSLFDEIIFSSPSTIKNFISHYGKPPKNIRIKAIGPTTHKEGRAHGMSIHIDMKTK